VVFLSECSVVNYTRGLATLISEKQVEEAADKVIRLIDDAKYYLCIPRKPKYDSATLLVICEDWNKAFDKIKEAKKVILEVVGQTWAESVPIHS
jgi:hypothetical protein